MFQTFSGFQSGEQVKPVTAPSGAAASPSGWTPSVLYMIALVIAEILAVGYLSTHLR